MSTRKFITIVVVAMVLFVLALVPMALACAEADNVYEVDAVIVNWVILDSEEYEVEAVDENGTIRAYRVNTYEDARIGTFARLSIEACEHCGAEKVVDAIVLNHLGTVEMVRWLCR